MAQSAHILEYQNPAVRRRRWPHWLILPLVWLPGSVASVVWYGDEYLALALANMPAVLTYELLHAIAPLVEFGNTMFFVVLIGLNVLILVAVGALWDMTRVPRRVYLFLPVAIAMVFGLMVVINLPQGFLLKAFPDVLSVVYSWSVYLLAVTVTIAALGSAVLARLSAMMRKDRAS